jgi:hypothetical protein
MAEKIREEFKIMLEELDWMDPEEGWEGGEEQGRVQDNAGGAGRDGSSGNEVVERIREELNIILEELDWMDPEVGGVGGEEQGGVHDLAEEVGLDGSWGRMRWWRGSGRSSRSFWRIWTGCILR